MQIWLSDAVAQMETSEKEDDELEEAVEEVPEIESVYLNSFSILTLISNRQKPNRSFSQPLY